MTDEEALGIAEQILPPGTLTPVKMLVFQQSWIGKEYAAIAKESGYDDGYIREAGAQLWRLLSDALREPVKKKNFRSLLQQRFSGQPVPSRPEAVVADLLNSSGVPEFPGGPVPIHSRFYVERTAIETKAYLEISKPGSLLRVNAPRKMGKSSLLLRIANHAAGLGYYTANLNFKQADNEIFSNLTKFLRWFCINISHQLELEPKLDDYWSEDTGSKASCTLYLTRYILRQLDAPLVLILNELDQVFENCDLSQEFLSLLQSWYEEARRVEILQKLRLVTAYSINVCVPLKLNQSLFNNVGLPIEPSEFSLEQVETLAQRYGLTWLNSSFAQELMSMIGGHPYLVQLALYQLWSKEVTLEQLLQEAATLSGIYSKHLQNYLAIVRTEPELETALKQVMEANDSIHLDPMIAYKLESLGLVNLKNSQIKPSYRLYQLYFNRQLMSA